MSSRACSAWLAVLLAAGAGLHANTLSFEAALSGPTGAFSGTAQFHFALVDAEGRPVWQTGAPEAAGSRPVTLEVRQGAIRAALGDTAAGFPAIPAETATRPGLRLRVWMRTEENGWKRIGADEPLPADRASQPMSVAQGEELLRELRELRTQVARLQQPAAQQRQPAPPQVVSVPLADAPAIGSPDAEWVLVEFTDFQCPFCRRFSEEVLPAVRERLIDTGRVRFVARELPLAMHALAAPAARVALLAHSQGRYWNLRPLLFANNGSLTEARITELGVEAGLDRAAVVAALGSQELQARVAADVAAAGAAGITGTPSFVFGRVQDGVVRGVRLIGAGTAQTFLNQLENEIAAAKRGAPAGGTP